MHTRPGTKGLGVCSHPAPHPPCGFGNIPGPFGLCTPKGRAQAPFRLGHSDQAEKIQLVPRLPETDVEADRLASAKHTPSPGTPKLLPVGRPLSRPWELGRCPAPDKSSIFLLLPLPMRPPPSHPAPLTPTWPHRRIPHHCQEVTELQLTFTSVYPHLPSPILSPSPSLLGGWYQNPIF